MPDRPGRSARVGDEPKDRSAAARASGERSNGAPATGGLGRGGPPAGSPGDLGAAACAHGIPMSGRLGRAGSRGGTLGDPGWAPPVERTVRNHIEVVVEVAERKVQFLQIQIVGE